jgi:hypothetical protein
MVGNLSLRQPVRFESLLHVCTSNTPLSRELIIAREANRFRERNIFHGCFERYGEVEGSVLIIKQSSYTPVSRHFSFCSFCLTIREEKSNLNWKRLHSFSLFHYSCRVTAITTTYTLLTLQIRNTQVRMIIYFYFLLRQGNTQDKFFLRA